MDSIWTTFHRELARMSDPQWGWYRTGMQHVSDAPSSEPPSHVATWAAHSGFSGCLPQSDSTLTRARTYIQADHT